MRRSTYPEGGCFFFYLLFDQKRNIGIKVGIIRNAAQFLNVFFTQITVAGYGQSVNFISGHEKIYRDQHCYAEYRCKADQHRLAVPVGIPVPFFSFLVEDLFNILTKDGNIEKIVLFV